MSEHPIFAFHIGAHRTGTTSLQALLDDRRSELNKFHVDALTPPRELKRNDLLTVRDIYRKEYKRQSVLNFQFRTIKAIKRYYFDRARNKILNLSCKNIRRLIISEEDMLGKPIVYNMSSILYPQAKDRLQFIQGLTAGDEVEIFIAIRCYDTFLFSLYLKQLSYSPNIKFNKFREFAKQIKNGWPEVIRNITNELPNASIRVWRHEAMNLCLRFSQLTNLSSDEVGGLDHNSQFFNASPTKEAIAAIEETSKLRKLQPADSDTLIKEYAGGTRFNIDDFLSPDEQSLLQNLYGKHLDEINTLPGISLT